MIIYLNVISNERGNYFDVNYVNVISNERGNYFDVNYLNVISNERSNHFDVNYLNVISNERSNYFFLNIIISPVLLYGLICVRIIYVHDSKYENKYFFDNANGYELTINKAEKTFIIYSADQKYKENWHGVLEGSIAIPGDTTYLLGARGNMFVHRDFLIGYPKLHKQIKLNN